MSPDKKIELFYDAYRRHPQARVGTVVQRINRLEKTERQTERLRSELDTASDRRSRMLADSEGETVLGRLIRKLRRG